MGMMKIPMVVHEPDFMIHGVLKYEAFGQELWITDTTVGAWIITAVLLLIGLTKNIHMGLIKAGSQVIGYLSAHGENHTMRLLKIKNVHDTLISELIEIEAITHVIIGGNGLGIVINHH